MEFSDIPGVYDLVQLAAASGIRHAVISPGSRNAPLSISLHRHPDIETFVIPDERVAGFFALGLAQQTNRPVMLCCTSGSAALNYAPALAEAYYQRVPLLAVTADRPEEWIDQGDGQTIRQRNVYRNYIRHSTVLIQDADNASDIAQNRERIIEAIDACMQPAAGPVHINFPLSEPLYRTRSYAESEMPVMPERKEKPTSPVELDPLAEDLKGQSRVLILCGMLPPNQTLNEVLGLWSALPQVIVLTETTSNLRHPNFLPGIDRLIFGFDENDLGDFRPDVLITLGHSIVSKKIKAILRQNKPRHHWHIDLDSKHPNTFQALTRSIHASPADVLSGLIEIISPENSSYRDHWLARDKAIDAAHDAFMATCPHSDHKAVEALLNVLPENSHFHLGNSASVRYVQLFKQGRTEHCFSNRGTSGIDGCTSTAMGAATATGAPTVLLTGDMAFFYDSNAFWHPHAPGNLKIVVLNNGGGGIFRIIEGPKEPEEVEKYFEAHHGQTAERLAKMYDIPYHSANDSVGLEVQLKNFLHATEGLGIFEIFTPRLENDRVLKNYFKALQTAHKSVKTHTHE